MAERRMFAKTIIDSDAFLDMPQSTQLLYFHLSMRADDDGFINNPKSIMRNTKCNEDDIKLLITKKFIIPFESGIVVIKHWKIHNYIAKDRYKETKYKEEKALLSLDENNSYTSCIQPVYKMDTQVRLGKDRLGKDRLGKDRLGKDRLGKKESKKESFDDLIDNYTENEELKSELKNHLAVRKAKKGAMTNRAIELSLNKLSELTKDIPVNEAEAEKTKIVQQSIENGWVGFFELKKQYKAKKTNDGWDYLNEEFEKVKNDLF